VVDASVALKWYLDEEGSREARAMRTQFEDGEVKLHAPELLLLEAANAFRFNRNADEDAVQERIEKLAGYGIIFHGVETGVLRSAINLAWSRGITIYDALYCALAKELHIPLITADGVLMRKLEGTGIAIPLAGIKVDNGGGR
jgi:predicted nucleic acid-binding protein